MLFRKKISKTFLLLIFEEEKKMPKDVPGNYVPIRHVSEHVARHVPKHAPGRYVLRSVPGRHVLRTVHKHQRQNRLLEP